MVATFIKCWYPLVEGVTDKCEDGNIEFKGAIDGVKKMVDTELQLRKCKYCGSYHVRRYGHYKGVQRLFCNDCERKFVDNDALPGMKTPADYLGSAVSMFYEGMSLNAIRRQLLQQYGIYPSDSTVYEWTKCYTKEAVSKANTEKPQVGDVWVADETVLKVGGKNTWF